MRALLFIAAQYLAPQHLLSRLVGRLASTRIAGLKSLLIHVFAKKFSVDMGEAAQESLDHYPDFNAFFVRALKPAARPIDMAANALVSPADGAVSQLGTITASGRIFQAKGRDFSACELLGGNSAWAEQFNRGTFATIYLSPKDYHRVHMPFAGKLLAMSHVPGDLFSVNPTTTDRVPRLFARNERVVCMFDTALGPMALVLVGAMIVASIETVWAGQVAPTGKGVTTTHYADQAEIALQKGEEMGRFKLGSTVVLLFPEHSVAWHKQLGASSALKMGEAIGTVQLR